MGVLEKFNISFSRRFSFQPGLFKIIRKRNKSWSVIYIYSFPIGSSACNAGDLDSIPGSGRYPGEGNGHPLQYSCLENSLESLVVYNPWGCKRVEHDWTTNTYIFKFSHNLFLMWCCEIVILCNENLLWVKLKEILLLNIISTGIKIFTLLWGWALFTGYLVQTIKMFNTGKGKTVQTVKATVVINDWGREGRTGSTEDFQGSENTLSTL